MQPRFFNALRSFQNDIYATIFECRERLLIFFR
jgi:hypothetical protein